VSADIDAIRRYSATVPIGPTMYCTKGQLSPQFRDVTFEGLDCEDWPRPVEPKRGLPLGTAPVTPRRFDRRIDKYTDGYDYHRSH
jgi:hypothetical protein